MSTAGVQQPWPVEIRVSEGGRTFNVSYDDGRADALSAELLRVESPSAEVQGHTPDQKVLIAGKKDVTIKGVEPVGSYAVRLIFSDGHTTGIFPWSYLRGLVDRHDEIWTRYLNDLAARGLTR